MRILHLEAERYPEASLRQLSTQHDVEIRTCRDQQELYSLLTGHQYEAIFTRLGLMVDQRAMALQSNLRYIVTPTTGHNHIDLEAAAGAGVEIVSLKGETEFLGSIKSTAEHTWGLLLSLIRHIPAAHDHVVNGGWEREPFLSDELDGKTLGIIGYGRLGKIVARYGLVFSMRVMIHDRNHKIGGDTESIEAVGIEKLLADADYVVLMISWSKANENFMDRDKFAGMKEGAYFVNTARGELVSEDALLEALRSGRLRGAALDVLNDDSSWSGKSRGSADLLAYAKESSNLLITPHMGGYGEASIRRTRSFITQKFMDIASPRDREP